MAAVDSFYLLLDSLSKQYEEYKKWSIEVLAVIGALYMAKVGLTYGSRFVYKCWVVYKHSKEKNFVKIYGRWAIVTGCTSGIGQAFAKELAARGMNIVLIARNEDKLSSESRYLQRRYGVKTRTHVHDFNITSSDAYADIRRKIENLEIGILINNVGIHYDYPMYLTEVPHSILNSMCQINIASSVLMTKLAAELMMKRNRGLIVNMSSGASWSANPLITTYAASKAFTSFFSQAMNMELKDKNIHVQCIEPLYVATNMTSYSKLLTRFRLLTPDADSFVRNAVCTFGNVDSTSGHYSHSFQRVLIQLTPSWLYHAITFKLHSYLNREGVNSHRKQD